MNERIRELFKLAGGRTSTQNLLSKPVQVRETRELWDGNIDKFAQLIVDECARICAEDGETGNGYTCSAAILEHFGDEK